MRTITVAEVTEALDQVIIERGQDFVYRQDESGNCFYTAEDGSPDCVVGAIFAKVAPEAFQHFLDYEAPMDDGNGGVSRTPAGGICKFVRNHDADLDARYASHHLVEAETPALAKALFALQSMQDSQRTWGDSRDEYVKVLNRELQPA
ncbi:hypothetical protein SEA_SHARKBOY_49 [Microbacterium phage Sharkboy]|uniref:Cyclic nucleotide-binding domain-containing protein n=2 Tax=Dismasvirus dismas TaxID=2560588 RepID=A0A516KUB6_9CAUD|nr:hypothetical protein FDJ24_gp48 [Microbacterium phage Dismas]AUG84845.1 hypothetical protein PBI_DISMAS_48 [Microbacterium phage Dismas]QDP45285.1 hypothetical protein SEA_SHARKBOY_49 [Microbacterium phage Sharkboy]UYL86836.1 hypothetical protein SEA_RONA_48 [Microbacterium phage Rona]